MHRLVVVDDPPGPAFVDALRGAWDDGDAVFPLDHRLPPTAARRLVATMAPDRPVAPGDALVVATSGTTGEPRGVVLTHDALRASAAAASARLGVDPGRDRWLSCLPLAHVGGLGVVTRALVTATPLTFDRADATATLTAVVPTQLERRDHGRFRAVRVGGSADWRSDRPANVVHTYALTETGSGVVYDGVPLDGVEVRTDGDGAIDVRGPMLLRAYRDGTDPKSADGWLATGDVGRWDEAAGRLEVLGRADDVIVSGGEKVWPAPVEAVLRRHPGVAEVAVVGRADREWGQRVVAVVVSADPADPPRLDELRAAVKERLGPWAAPRELVLTGALPRTALGKVRRRAL